MRHTVIGTPFYLAPEVIQEVGYDFKVDIWALGITAIEMAEKEPPHYNVHTMRLLYLIPLNPSPTLTHTLHWSEEFNDFLAMALKKDPNERPNASELLKVILTPWWLFFYCMSFSFYNRFYCSIPSSERPEIPPCCL